MKAGIIRKLSAVALAGLLFGCGPEGDDGLTYMSFDWSSSTGGFYFSGNTNYSLPSTIVRWADYQVQPGTYSMTVWGANAGCNTYYLSYSITADEGEPGIHPLLVGPDGDDTYYDVYIWCYSAPDIYISGEEVSAPELVARGTNSNEVGQEVVNQASVGVLADAPVKTITKVSGGFRLVAEVYEIK